MSANKPPANTDPSFQDVLLRIDRVYVGTYLTPPAVITTDADVDSALLFEAPAATASKGVLPLARAPLDELVKYSRSEESGWLIDLAHDICDPANKTGILYSFNGPNPEDFLQTPYNDCLQEWGHVMRTDSLRPTIYEYRFNVPTVIRLSKISERAGHSSTSVSSTAKTMKNHVMARDNRRCWVTGPGYTRHPTLINSRIIPKRMGDAMARAILEEFEGIPATGLGIYNAIFGITLFTGLDKWFDDYDLGFRNVNGHYEAHVFPPSETGNVNKNGAPFAPGGTDELLHARIITVPPNNTTHRQPPPGLFRWHYLQCFIKHFGSDEYKKLDHIAHMNLSLDMGGDSDYGEGGDPDFTWPTAILDRGREASRLETVQYEKAAFIEDWLSGGANTCRG